MNCGSPLVQRWVAADFRDRKICPACHTVHYDSPKVLVTCICHWQGRIIMCKRGIEPAKGLWEVPGGFVEYGETLEQAAAREVYEEVGLEVEPGDLSLFRVTSVPSMNQIFIGFRVEMKGEPQFSLGPETLDARLFSEDEINVSELAFVDPKVHDYPFDFFRSLRSGSFPVFAITIASWENG
jgi:ADP-ribose pyrophosphatase YjhB (NUDIX family)